MFKNGIKIEDTADIIEMRKNMIMQKLTRPRTLEEGLIELNRINLMEKLKDNEDKTLAISCMALFEVWSHGEHKVGDIRTNPTTKYPYECMIEHDSTVNTDWTIDVRTIWKPYHSRKKEYALPFEQPTGSHDMYKIGEYVVWIDGKVYKCLSDTNFNPSEYTQAWEVV